MLLNFLKRTLHFADALSEYSGRLTAWLSTLLVLLTCFNVGARYLFNYANGALSELEWHIFSLIFLIGAAYTLKYDRHVRVDVFYHHFSEKRKAWINLIGTLFFLMPFALIVIKGSIPYTQIAYHISEKSSDPSGCLIVF